MNYQDVKEVVREVELGDPLEIGQRDDDFANVTEVGRVRGIPPMRLGFANEVVL